MVGKIKKCNVVSLIAIALVMMLVTTAWSKQSWQFEETVDLLNRTKTAHIVNRVEPGVMQIEVSCTDVDFKYVGTPDRLMRGRMRLRFDEEPIIDETTSFYKTRTGVVINTLETPDLVERMKKHNLLVARSYLFHNEIRDDVISLSGFTAAYGKLGCVKKNN